MGIDDPEPMTLCTDIVVSLVTCGRCVPICRPWKLQCAPPGMIPAEPQPPTAAELVKESLGVVDVTTKDNI